MFCKLCGGVGGGNEIVRRGGEWAWGGEVISKRSCFAWQARPLCAPLLRGTAHEKQKRNAPCL